jgi:galactokinase
VAVERSRAFAPGRVNLIGEHTDYNEGLALPFAIAEGVTVSAEAAAPGSPGAGRISVYARALAGRDEFDASGPERVRGWRAFVRGIVAELARAGRPLLGAQIEIGGDVPRGAGLSSSAALEVALCLALAAISSSDAPMPLLEIARLCSRVENDWAGAHTGLLDQLASLYGAPDTAAYIDFRALSVEAVPLALGDWRLVVLDSGEAHAHASSGYNERRAECASACELLGVPSLRDADLDAGERLPEPLNRRVRHVISENQRVRDTVAALRAQDLAAVGELLDASHASLRDDYEISTPTVEVTARRLRDAGASGARLVGGGFGGSVLGLFAPGVAYPLDAREVRPSDGAHLLVERSSVKDAR